MELIDWIIHFDRHLNEVAGAMGGWLYLLLFLIIFCETGLVVTPFLPGDSLLFAVGAMAAIESSPLNLSVLMILLIVAAVLGDGINYAIGRFVGPKVFVSESSRLLNKEHLNRAQRFYEKYGSKAIVLARFAPILRTFAPFVAGIGKMNYPKFWFYNVGGAVLWVILFLLAGYRFGNLPWVKRYFQLVILGIIVVSLLPIAYEWYQATKENRTADRTT